MGPGLGSGPVWDQVWGQALWDQVWGQALWDQVWGQALWDQVCPLGGGSARSRSAFLFSGRLQEADEGEEEEDEGEEVGSGGSVHHGVR